MCLDRTVDFPACAPRRLFDTAHCRGGCIAAGGVWPLQNLHGAKAHTRSPRAAFCDHLELRRLGQVQIDIQRNYADDVVLLNTGSLVRKKPAEAGSKNVWLAA